MPSAKKIAPRKIATATKSKAAVPETKSNKQRSSKISGSGSKEKAKSATTPIAVGKTRKAAAAQARRSETRSKTAATRSAAGRAATKPAASKAARTERSKAAVSARGAAPRATAAASRKQAPNKQSNKQAQKKATEAQSAARASTTKRQEKSAAPLPRVTRKKAAPVQETASLKVARGKAAKETRIAIAEEAASQTINSVSVVSEAVVVRGAEQAPPPSAAEPQARASEPATVTLATSDHQPVTQRTQKKTAAAPVATIAGAAEAVSVAPVAATPVVKPAAPKAAVAPEAKPRDVKPAVSPADEGKSAEKPVAAKPAKAVAKPAFKTAEFIVYPAHGVGQIIAIEEQEVAGFKLELFVISFVKDKMILKVPVPKAASVGMRKLGTADVVKKALATLSGRARIKRTMWSRRAQEYEAKINSGDLVAIAEVVRDLYRSEAQPEQSYSERQLYEAALDRVAREIAVVQKLTETESLRLIEGQLQKGPRRSKVEEADTDLADADEGDIEEAA